MRVVSYQIATLLCEWLVIKLHPIVRVVRYLANYWDTGSLISINLMLSTGFITQE